MRDSDEEDLPENCHECDTKLVEGPPIGLYCPNQDCDVFDGPFGKSSLDHGSEMVELKKNSNLPERVTLSKGFTKIEGKRYEAGQVERFEVRRQKQMHKFGEGYQDVGVGEILFSGTAQDAQNVYEMLKEFFDDE